MVLFGTVFYFVLTFWILANVDDWGMGAFVAWLMMNVAIGVSFGTINLGFV